MHISLTGHIEVSGEFMEIALRELFTNYPIRAAIIAWTIAQGIKVLLNVFEKAPLMQQEFMVQEVCQARIRLLLLRFV